LEKEIKEGNKVTGQGDDPKNQGVFHRFLQWISKGTEKATRNGSFCNT